jgi:lipoprotein-anchoring transpeptidase ErfK/SrfK
MPATIGPGASNPLGLRAMNLNNAKGKDTGYRIHGTSKLGSIGTAASHGCIRVANKNIVKLYKKVPTGTPVVVQP